MSVRLDSSVNARFHAVSSRMQETFEKQELLNHLAQLELDRPPEYPASSLPTESVFLTSPSAKKSSSDYKSGSLDTRPTKPLAAWAALKPNVGSPRLLLPSHISEEEVVDFKSSQLSKILSEIQSEIPTGHREQLPFALVSPQGDTASVDRSSCIVTGESMLRQQPHLSDNLKAQVVGSGRDVLNIAIPSGSVLQTISDDCDVETCKAQPLKVDRKLLFREQNLRYETPNDN